MKQTHSPLPPASFYSADTYRSQDSIGWLMHRIKQSIVHLADKRLCQHDLTHAQWAPMLRLRLHGPSSTLQLSKDLDVDAGALSRLLDRLEAKGLVVRERSSTDRRVVQVSLSEEGQRVTAELPAVLSEVFNAHLAGFTEAEWRTLIELLQRLVANGEALRESSKE
ncbi:MarR family transcriptional regulator [Pelomonas sp. APW6]|uniref:MarR family transcriptional regulator n=1 Tax=Roseateles subflavus TaxID=3053353 RepID=A0ABT7LPH3_9BURK|nr:MarR family transcriptional regulator [Pelomonas sp. APW6]MDL5033401.1 MarR family transcriptional regulator [Pelomonas sp. APW6]